MIMIFNFIHEVFGTQKGKMMSITESIEMSMMFMLASYFIVQIHFSSLPERKPYFVNVKPHTVISQTEQFVLGNYDFVEQ